MEKPKNATKYPILLLHGAGFRDLKWPLYWGRIPAALSGMGVAFYTSLVGAGCSILLTILKTIFNPQAAREQMETRMELWLDTEVAPDLYTEAAKNDADLVRRMIAALKAASDDFGAAAQNASAALAQVCQL